MDNIEECTHHWVLETPNGSWAEATCKKCGSRAKFPNAQYDLWNKLRVVYYDKETNEQKISNE